MSKSFLPCFISNYSCCLRKLLNTHFLQEAGESLPILLPEQQKIVDRILAWSQLKENASRMDFATIVTDEALHTYFKYHIPDNKEF